MKRAGKKGSSGVQGEGGTMGKFVEKGKGGDIKILEWRETGK